jgi:hypothetical protein
MSFSVCFWLLLSPFVTRFGRAPGERFYSGVPCAPPKDDGVHAKLYRFFVMFDKARMNKGLRDKNGGHCQ